MFPTRKGIPPFAGGFTLIELLVVIAIFAILAAATVPSLSSLLGTKGVTRAAVDAASVLELARAEAMARRTYVYVGFENTSNALGNSELCIAAAASPDGSSAATTGLLPLTRVVRLENVRQTNYAGLPQVVRAAATNATNSDDYASGMTSTGISFTNGRQIFSSSMVVISPEGELLAEAGSPVFLERMHLGLIGMRGTAPMTNDGGVVTFDGGSGAISIIRP